MRAECVVISQPEAGERRKKKPAESLKSAELLRISGPFPLPL
jgi:hypothetical protein